VTEPAQNEGFVSQDHIRPSSVNCESANTHIQTYNTIYEVQIKVITYSAPCIRVLQQKRKLQKTISEDNSEFMWKRLSLIVKHTLFTLEESGLPQTTYACESQ
jgi:hypothetical protein